jgi:hypothetical protein
MDGLFRSLSRSRRNSTSSPVVSIEVPTDMNFTPLAHKPSLVIAASTPSFDPVLLQQWKDESFDVHFKHVHGDSRSATYSVESVGETLEDGEKYAIVRLRLKFSNPIYLPIVYCTYKIIGSI